MRTLPLLAGLALLTVAAAPALSSANPVAPLPDGTWTNEEHAYFENLRGAVAPPWTGLRVRTSAAGAHEWQPIDKFGGAIGDWRTTPIAGLGQSADGHWAIGGSEIRRAAGFTCWMSIRKFANKPDGSEDWTYAGKLANFDQGGRVRSGGGSSGAPEAIFRLRNVIWPAPSTNRPSLVLYVHRPDSPDHAESYVWADPDAKLIGINLRWVQGSCTRDEG